MLSYINYNDSHLPPLLSNPFPHHQQVFLGTAERILKEVELTAQQEEHMQVIDGAGRLHHRLSPSRACRAVCFSLELSVCIYMYQCVRNVSDH